MPLRRSKSGKVGYKRTRKSGKGLKRRRTSYKSYRSARKGILRSLRNVRGAAVRFGKSYTLNDVRHAGQSGSTFLEHEEVIDTFLSPAPPTVSVNSFAINPTNPVLFPWLSTLAPNWQQHKWHRLEFTWVTFCGDAISSTNNALGTMVAAVDYNSMLSILTPPSTIRQVENMDGSVSAKPSRSFTLRVNCSPKSLLSPILYNAYRIGGTNIDNRLSILGVLWMLFSGMQAAGVVLGELRVKYIVELIRPITKDMNPTIPTSYRGEVQDQALYSGLGGISPSGFSRFDSTEDNPLAPQDPAMGGTNTHGVYASAPLGTYWATMNSNIPQFTAGNAHVQVVSSRANSDGLDHIIIPARGDGLVWNLYYCLSYVGGSVSTWLGSDPDISVDNRVTISNGTFVGPCFQQTATQASPPANPAAGSTWYNRGQCASSREAITNTSGGGGFHNNNRVVFSGHIRSIDPTQPLHIYPPFTPLGSTDPAQNTVNLPTPNQGDTDTENIVQFCLAAVDDAFDWAINAFNFAVPAGGVP